MKIRKLLCVSCAKMIMPLKLIDCGPCLLLKEEARIRISKCPKFRAERAAYQRRLAASQKKALIEARKEVERLGLSLEDPVKRYHRDRSDARRYGSYANAHRTFIETVRVIKKSRQGESK